MLLYGLWFCALTEFASILESTTLTLSFQTPLSSHSYIHIVKVRGRTVESGSSGCTPLLRSLFFYFF